MDNCKTQDSTMEVELTLKEYYNILSAMCDKLEENPDDDTAIAAFADAAYHIGKSKCGHLFPDDMLTVNAAKTPGEGTVITAVKEDD